MNSTKERIKQVALKLLAEKGYAGTALSEIALECGIKTPSIYGHFPSKEQLLLEIWSELVSDYRNLMERLLLKVEGMPAEEQLFYLVDGYGVYFLEHPETYKLWARMLMFPPLQFKERIMEDCSVCEGSVLERISQLLSAGVERGEIKQAPIEDLLAGFTILKEGYVQWLFFYGPEQTEEQTRRMWRLLWGGFQGDLQSQGNGKWGEF